MGRLPIGTHTALASHRYALSACAASPDHAAYCPGLGGAAAGGLPGAALWHPALGFLLLVGLRVGFPPKHGAGYTGSKAND